MRDSMPGHLKLLLTSEVVAQLGRRRLDRWMCVMFVPRALLDRAARRPELSHVRVHAKERQDIRRLTRTELWRTSESEEVV